MIQGGSMSGDGADDPGPRQRPQGQLAGPASGTSGTPGVAHPSRQDTDASTEQEERMQRGIAHVFAEFFNPEERKFAHAVMRELGDDEDTKIFLIATMMTNALRRRYGQAQASTETAEQAEAGGHPGREAGQA